MGWQHIFQGNVHIHVNGKTKELFEETCRSSLLWKNEEKIFSKTDTIIPWFSSTIITKDQLDTDWADIQSQLHWCNQKWSVPSNPVDQYASLFANIAKEWGRREKIPFVQTSISETSRKYNTLQLPSYSLATKSSKNQLEIYLLFLRRQFGGDATLSHHSHEWAMENRAVQQMEVHTRNVYHHHVTDRVEVDSNEFHLSKRLEWKKKENMKKRELRTRRRRI